MSANRNTTYDIFTLCYKNVYLLPMRRLSSSSSSSSRIKSIVVIVNDL